MNLEEINKKWAIPLIVLVGSAITVYFSYITNNLSIKSENLKNTTIQIENDLKQREFKNALKLKMYDEVKYAILNNDEKLQTAVLLLINEMLADDSLFREKLITVVLSSPKTNNSVIKIQEDINEKINVYYSAESNKNSESFMIDVFYLEEIINESKPRAEKTVDVLKNAFPNYVIRLRLLPRGINAKTGFRISSNEIRFEENEKGIAEKIKQIITEKKIFELEQPKLNEISPINKTPKYLSIFIRNM